jgi:fatty-acyl-CoA synthase
MVVTGYGSSEGGITLLPSRRHGALGRAPEGSSIAVIDPVSGREQDAADIDEHGLLRNPDRAIGELVRKDGVGSFEGYWGNAEADTDRVRGGWFYSGDLAYRDADGVFYFAGRVGDWVRVDSENFATAPIERIIGRYPPIDAVAVFGVPDPHSGDRVMAAVEMSEGNEFDPAGFATWLAEQPDLGTKWAPTFVRVCDRLPTVGHDKIDRRALRETAWLTDDPVWSRPSRTTEFDLLTDEDRDALRSSFATHGRAALHPTEVHPPADCHVG